MPRKSERKKVRNRTAERIRKVRVVPEAEPQPVYSAEAIRELLNNRPALFGFLLSVLQLIGHTTWILLIWYLDTTGQAKSLNSDSWISWGVVGLFGMSLILTFVSLFVCLYYGLRRSPRALAVIGFSLSFFTGTLATTLLIMTGLRAMSGG